MGHTMREVAKRAGVSPATVSRVLNKTHYISCGDREARFRSRRANEILQECPRPRLATGRSDLFGLVISEIANPYFPRNDSRIPGRRLGSAGSTSFFATPNTTKPERNPSCGS